MTRDSGRAGLVTSGNRAEGMRRANASAVLRAVLGQGGTSRAEITRQTGLSAPSVTKLTASLIEAGLLTEGETLPPADLGRPRVLVRIDRDHRAALGMHIGLERTTLGLVALDGTVLAQEALLHNDLSPAGIVEQAVDGVTGFVRAHRAGRVILGTGVSIGGWVDDGVVVEHAPLGWANVALRDHLTGRVPGPVRLEQHVRATAEAELWFGAGRDTDDLVVIFVGHVVDAAIVLNRTIHRGPGSAAGGIDHLLVAPESAVTCACGRTGCLQAVAGDAALLLAASSRLGLPDPGLDQVIAAAREGLPEADRLLRERAVMVGRAVATVVDLVNPGRVVLAGGVIRDERHLGDLRAEAVRLAHRDHDLAGRITATTLGPGALVVSAAAPVLAAILADPLGGARGGTPGGTA